MTKKPGRSLQSKYDEGRHSCAKPSDQDELSLMATAGEWKELSLFMKKTDGTAVDKGLLTSHEIKRCLLLGRKVMTNLDSILKSRDITLPTKVCLFKAMVFPVLMYGCESWSAKKAESRRIDAFNCGVGEDS